MRSVALALALLAALPGCNKKSQADPRAGLPTCKSGLVHKPLPADWATFPVVAVVGEETKWTRWEGHDITTTSRVLGPFVVSFLQHENATPSGGFRILRGDCRDEGLPAGGDDLAFYMLGTASLRQKNDLFVLTVRGPTEDRALAFQRE